MAKSNSSNGGGGGGGEGDGGVLWKGKKGKKKPVADMPVDPVR